MTLERDSLYDVLHGPRIQVACRLWADLTAAVAAEAATGLPLLPRAVKPTNRTLRAGVRRPKTNPTNRVVRGAKSR